MGADEPSDWSFLLLLPKSVRTLPADLAAVVVLVFLACLFTVVPGLNETPLRVIFGLPLVLFLPGYALTAVLFPGTTSSTGDENNIQATANEGDQTGGGMAQSILALSGGSNRGLTGLERIALSLGLSTAIVPLLGLAVDVTPWGIRLWPILAVLSGWTLGLTSIAAIRRLSLPEDNRFRVPYRKWLGAGRAELLEPDTRLDGVINVLMVCSLLLVVGSVAYVVVVPSQSATFTEFYVLNEDESGELVAANYSSEFVVGESQPVTVGIDNHEHESVEYTVVVQLQTVTTENNETTVLTREEIDRFTSPLLEHNESWQREHDIQPTMAGTQLRVQYLLYRGQPPESPTEETSYRSLHLWINVTAGNMN